MKTELPDGTTIVIADGKWQRWRKTVLLKERDATLEELEQAEEANTGAVAQAAFRTKIANAIAANITDIAQADLFDAQVDQIIADADAVIAASTNPAIDALAEMVKDLATGERVLAHHSKSQATQLNAIGRFLLNQLEDEAP